MAKRTTAHAVKFTDADWMSVAEGAHSEGMTPAAYANVIIGRYLAEKRGVKWDGLLEQGRPFKKQPAPQSEGDA